MKDAELVTAYRGNVTRQFTRRNWDILGTDTYGWQLVPEVPKEVAAAISPKEQPSQTPPVVLEATPTNHKPRGRKKK